MKVCEKKEGNGVCEKKEGNGEEGERSEKQVRTTPSFKQFLVAVSPPGLSYSLLWPYCPSSGHWQKGHNRQLNMSIFKDAQFPYPPQQPGVVFLWI